MAASKEKQNLIVNEIESWRRSKLLPEQYCDFLQNIYLDDLNERPTGLLGQTINRIGKATGKQWFLFFVLFSFFCLILLYFSVFPVALQIGLAIGISALLTRQGIKRRQVNVTHGLLTITAGMGSLAIVGFMIIILNDWVQNSGILWVLGLCALIWMGMGILLRFAILHSMGWLALIVLYAWLLSQHAEHPSWLEVQIFWIPASCLFIWLSWFFQVRNKEISAVFFTNALILWFMPEVYSILLHMNRDWLQIELLAKLLIAGVGMFRLRNKWMEWVV